MDLPVSASAPFEDMDDSMSAHRSKKNKKHKKRHKHDRHESSSGLDGTVSGQAGPIKIRIRVGDEEEHKKKKKKKIKKKDKDKEKKHKHKRRDKRKKEEAVEEGGSAIVGVADESETPAKRLLLETAVSQNTSPRPKTPSGENEQQSCAVGESKSQRRPLSKLLDYCLPLLEKKDSNGFFSNPVTDLIAPGYSQIIKQPMDFLTMRTKLAAGSYTTLKNFSNDFELICTNAMTYNQKDTIFYKSAKRLLQLGQNLISTKKLLQLREQLPFMKDISTEEIGFDINSPVHEEEEDDDDDDSRDISKVIEDIREVVKRPLGRFEAIPDDMSPQEILEHAQKAAQGAAERLKIHRPNSQLGFLRQKPDGTTSLNFLPGGKGVIAGTEKDRPVTLGALIGKVKTGSGNIQGFKEDRRNVAKSAHPLYYGAYSSHAPTHDSTFANLTHEETDLVFSTYGDEVGVQYAESILNYSRNCDYAMFIVDHLLDILTQNEHRKTTKYLEEKKALRKEDHLLNVVFDPSTRGEEEETSQLEEDTKHVPPTPLVDFTGLKSLSDDGIDMSFLDSLQTQYLEDPSLQLQETAVLLAELKQIQLERLSQPIPPHVGLASRAGDKEQQLADSIRANLTHLVRSFRPTDVVPEECVHKLLGIPIKVKQEKDECTGAGEPNPYAIPAADVE